MSLTPSAIWRITPQLVVALDAHLGSPVDSYVNGSQTWLTDDGPGGTPLEWRLHPAPGFRLPEGCTHYDVWDSVVDAITTASDTVVVHGESRGIAALWEGLECFPAYGDEIEPAVLARSATAAIGIPPDGAGLVDHGRIGAAWERAPGEVSMISLLLADLEREAG